MAAYAYFIQWRGPYQAVPIHEHETNVRISPEKFGLTKKAIDEIDAKHKALNERRREILLAVMRKGWIRMRNHGANMGTTFEFISGGKEDAVMDAIAKFGSEVDIKPLDYVRFTDLGDSRTAAMTWKKFKEAEGDSEKILGPKPKAEKEADPEEHARSPLLKTKQKKDTGPATGSVIVRAAQELQKQGIDPSIAMFQARQQRGYQEASMESSDLSASERLYRIGQEAARMRDRLVLSKGKSAVAETAILLAMAKSAEAASSRLSDQQADLALKIAKDLRWMLEDTARRKEWPDKLTWIVTKADMLAKSIENR